MSTWNKKTGPLRKAALAGTTAIMLLSASPLPISPPLTAYAQDEGAGYYVTAADGHRVTISGVNMTRGPGMLVAYNPIWGYSSSTNAFGAEVVLDSTGVPGEYMVKEVNSAFGDLSKSGNSTIPLQGLVLSAGPGGTPDVRKDLISHFKAGDLVKVNEPIAQTSEAQVHAVDPSPSNNPDGALFDGYRGPNQLLVYTPAFGATTRTNQYGFEITVVDGIVQTAGGANSAIPDNGFVVSAHGTQAAWLSSIAETGAKVQLNGNRLTVTKDASSYVYQAEQAIKDAEASILRATDHYLNVPFDKANQSIAEAKALTEKAAGTLESDPVKSVYVSKQAISVARDAFYYSLPSRAAESRGVWYRPQEKTPEQIAQTLDRMKAAGFNELYLETLFQGYTIFPSQVAKDNGIVNQNPIFKGWDPLQVFMEEAKKRGIAVHAWLDGFMVGISPGGGPILSAHPEWSAVARNQTDAGKPMPQKSNGYYWMDITNPEAQNYLLNLTKEMVTRYGMAGVNLDYMRFPHASDWKESYNFSAYSRSSFQQAHGVDPYTIQPESQPEMWKTWTDWIVQAEDKFVQKVYNDMKAINSQIVISATPEPGAEAEKIGNWSQYVDVVIPQAYSYSVDSVRTSVEQHMAELKPGNLTYSGIFPMYVHMGPYETVAQVLAARDIDHGTTIFAFGQASPLSVEALKKGPWREDAVSTGMHPFLAITALMDSIRKDIKEVYIPRKAINEKTAQELNQRMDQITHQLDKDLPWAAYQSTANQIRALESYLLAGKQDMPAKIAERLSEQTSYAGTLLSYAITKRIR
ncbi:hypothetical protein SY83_09095 [Paenibacillus swuensis]|uniref:Glycosyl hydrolase-like 10 domain-containing protein n=1 Tax=Paenibacillus swuensis TaxID=1178515 RepID=A0A172TH75_9BACL|nr:family 10 glycosylhydrolase [Paenibacillus swuensis]ANE46409.1 hypothetical protein SY83_09095 [Paenibacillus swuensis]